MTNHERWHKYPGDKPPKDGAYLIHLKDTAAQNLSIQTPPPIAIAKFTIIDRQWTLKNAGTPIPPRPISDDDIIEWHEIPPFTF